MRSDTRTVTAFVLSDLIATDAVRAHEPSLQRWRLRIRGQRVWLSMESQLLAPET